MLHDVISILTPITSKDGVVVDSAFCEESGVHESTTLTLDKEHNQDLGGIAITLAERLHTLTGTLTVAPGDFKETTLGHIHKITSPLHMLVSTLEI